MVDLLLKINQRICPGRGESGGTGGPCFLIHLPVEAAISATPGETVFR